MLTQQDALNQAVQLHNQKVNFTKIAEHLEKVGYKSPRTGRPLTPQAVRHMLTDHFAKDNMAVTPSKRYGNGTPTDDKPIHVRGDKADLIHAVKIVADLDLDAATKLGVLKALLAGKNS